MTKPQILIVEDDFIIAEELKQCLAGMGYAVTAMVDNGADAIETAERERPDLVLMDIRINGPMDGIDTAEIIRSRFGLPIVFLTAYVDEARIERAKLTMPFGYILKPFKEKDLRVTLEMALYIAEADAERHRTEKALQHSEHRMATHVRLTPMGVIEFDREFRITSWNPAAERIFGYSAAEAIGKSTFDLLVPDHETEAVKAIHRWENPTGSVNVNENRRKDGSIITCRWFNTPLLDTNNTVIGLTSTCQDITSELEAEKKLKESEEKHRYVFENAIVAICVIQNRRFRHFNPEAVKLFGYSEEALKHLPTDETVHPEDRELVASIRKRRRSGEEVIDYVHRVVTGDGRVIWVDIKAVSIVWDDEPAILVFLRDITEQKKSREMMIQTEKMMSLGELAASMAHEINNPLGGILQGVQNIRRRLSLDLKGNRQTAAETGISLENMQEYLERRGIYSMLQGIQNSGMKAAQIIANMLQFSRKSESKMAPSDLVALVEKVLDIADKHHDLEKGYDFRSIEIVKAFEERMPPVPCTETEIEQVLLNLLNNAAWAMSNAETGRSPQIHLRVSRQGESACIEIEDNGPGMSEETRRHIFEPFFTTKPVGEGTGLGLSVCYTIITGNHKGSIDVRSEPDKGTCFTIHLPLQRP